MDDMPLGEDGLIDFRALAVGLIETVADHAMELEVDALHQGEFDAGSPVPYLWLDATYVKCRDDDSRMCSQATVTAIGAFMDGTRRFVGFDLVDTEPYDSWKWFPPSLRRRGVSGVRLVTSDAHAGLRRAVMEVFDGASWQRCFVHLQRDLAARIRHRGNQVAPRTPEHVEDTDETQRHADQIIMAALKSTACAYNQSQPMPATTLTPTIKTLS